MGLMLVANDIKTYNSFILLDKEDIYLFEQIKSNGATTKLRPHYAKQVSNTREFISFLVANGDNTLVDDPTQWTKIDFEL